MNLEQNEEWLDRIEYEHRTTDPDGIVLITEETATRLHERAQTYKGPLGRTYKCSERLAAMNDADIARSLVMLIDKMAEMGWDVVTLLHYLSWNLTIPATMVHEQSVIRYARTALMVSPQLPGILSHWIKPPRAHARGIRTRGAKDVLEHWALENVTARITREMKIFAPNFYSPPHAMSEKMLLGTDMKQDIVKMENSMKTFWTLMSSLARTPRQIKFGKYKDYKPRIFIIASILQYNRSQNYCRYQKVLGIYLKSYGVCGQANDTTHLFGITMSPSWSYTGTEELAASQQRDMQSDMLKYIFYGSHDNINLPFRVYEMRLSNQTHFDSGTTGTVYIVKDETVPRPSRTAYLEQRAEGCRNPIRSRDIFQHEISAKPRLREHFLYLIKLFLLMHPAFTAFKAQNGDHPVFQRPPPVIQLPTGAEFATLLYMLQTVHMEESSQEGNRKVLEEWLRQFRLNGERGLNDADLDRLILWLGDLLTTLRIRSVKKDRSQDMNFMQRFEQWLEHPGWFHATLALEFSLHKQYFGKHTSMGFKHAFVNMGRKGLDRATTQGNFHYGFREGLKHTAEARFRDIWLTVSGAENFDELAKSAPEELDVLAHKILETYTLSSALADLRDLDPSQADDRLEHSVQFCRDMLDYLVLDDAMKTGDVGLMELLIPRMLFRFHGSASHNYAHEMLELMQGLWREWPVELKSFIMRFCWLANTTGHENEFLAFDMLQEHNVRDLKVTFAVHGPYASWDYIKKISASIPAQRKLKDHIEREFNHFRRGKSHTTPKHEKEVSALQKIYAKDKVHVYTPGRTVEDDEKAKDVYELGSNPVSLQAMITRWTNSRVKEKATTQNFETAAAALERLKEEHEREITIEPTD